MTNVKSVLLVGVGGQGTILMSKVLTRGLIAAGYDVKMSEVHGMAQRGGSVSTQVRYGEKVHSPLFGQGAADVLVSLERMEAVRWADYLKPDGIAIVNDYKILPMTVASGAAAYPDGTVEAMQKTFKTVAFDAAALAEEAGNGRTMNIVLFGALIRALGLEDIDWKAILRESVPEKFIEANLKAFELGMNEVKL
ncbi:MAG: indolepyruvate oxidoreductase subunit beta [Clostridia bacterium]|nr:indolepyruvate oxidoreductase subunit beta [Clostridia bacterium]MBQ9924435.1 indolepyruvate oxidoreductase subunit beta [Clostridia bacterium]